MRTTILQTITFGSDGNAVQFQGVGWSVPENGHTWSIGTQSELIVPGVNAPQGLYLELRCGPFGSQRFSVSINGDFIGAVTLEQPGTFAWQAPPISGTAKIILHHPDARQPLNVDGNGDDRQLGMSFRRIRLLPIIREDRTPYRFPTDVSGSEVAMLFESIGDNCELGLVQRDLGLEPLGLLRFSSAPIDLMIDGLDSGFAGIEDGLEAFDGFPSGLEWSMHAPRYGMRWHTFIPQTQYSPGDMVKSQGRRLGFLVRKFMEDAGGGEKIFVVKSRMHTLATEQVMALHLALNRVGPTWLLWAAEPDADARPPVEEIAPRLLRSTMPRIDKDASEWLTLMTNTLLFVRDRSAPKIPASFQDQSPMTHSARRINEIARRLNIRTYLEIGVCEGDTFRSVEIPEKTGVDPDFRFDVDAVRNDQTHLIAQTSDVYFASLPPSRKFDLIFIDGLHTFEQVVKDFSNAVLHSHDRSVIILDDTRPSDVFSSLPDHRDAAEFRRMAGGTSHDWHGDVFKVVFYINDFWPGMDYRTMVVGGNPQTLVWRASGAAQPPLFVNLETISRLSFFDFHKHITVLRPAGEEEAIAQCVNGIKLIDG